MSGLDELVRVMHRLRAECAWDREQTHASLVPYLLEESAELIDAIETDDVEGMREELGDVLYQVLFHADIAAAEEGFDISDVASATAEKMRRRHPHVFGNSTASTPEEITAQWAEVKRQEKATRTSVLDGIPSGMPALARAAKILGRAEEAGVVSAEDAPVLPFATEDELGALLLAVVLAARARGLDAERALRVTLRGLEDEIRAAERGRDERP
ncbi:MAG: nucleoside triphosphate hydrolase [Naasia sp.]|jgi:XTP/dITP diphosphohydrolase|uniref:MazG family protein n=1 Tax=Naasia sp. TaxID=2546198 RepID=UPI0026135EBE|nr:MazG family protein [Naasia sp.]MCU1569425.1 nucleoside triphosphate hydrolase [Naasia sp.]